MNNENVKKPGWVISIGVFGLAMALTGILTGIISATLPGIISAQKKAIPAMMSQAVNEKLKEAGNTTTAKSMTQTAKIQEDIASFLEKNATYPAWFEKYTLYAGLISILISLLCLAASITLLTGAKNAGLFFCASFLLSTAFSIANAVISFPTGMIIKTGAVASAVLVVFVNIVLVYVVITGKKAR